MGYFQSWFRKSEYRQELSISRQQWIKRGAYNNTKHLSTSRAGYHRQGQKNVEVDQSAQWTNVKWVIMMLKIINSVILNLQVK